MHIHGADAVLFLHIAVAVFTFGIAGLMLTGLTQMRNAEEISVLRSWARVNHRVEPWFPILVLVLIALGAWLIGLSHKEFSWSDGWVDTAIVGLVLMEAYGGIVLAPAGKKLHAMVEDEPNGRVSDELRAAVMNPMVWAGAYGNTGVALGILFTMPTKPAGPWAILIVAGTGLIAIGLGLRLSGARVRSRDAAEAHAVA
jgi:hypothetical protein